jgi:hypothetical protein
MSSAGSCRRVLSAERLGVPPVTMSDTTQNRLEMAAEEGKWHEKRILEELAQEFDKVESGVCLECEPNPDGSPRQGVHVEIEQDTFKLVGHLDGRLEKDGVARGLEIKSMSQREFDRWVDDRWEAFPQYAGQLACYFVASHLPVFEYVVKNRNNGYKDRHTALSMDFIPTYYNIIENIKKVEDLATSNQLCEAEFNPDSVECQRCSYKHLCIKPAEINTVDEMVLNKAIESWREGKRLGERGKAMVDSATEIIFEYAKAQPERRLLYNGIVATVCNYSRKSYPEVRLMAKFGADALKDVVEISQSQYCRITDTASKGGKK